MNTFQPRRMICLKRGDRKRRLPPSEKHCRGQRGYENHVGVFREKEHSERHARVFHVETGNDFGFPLRHIER